MAEHPWILHIHGQQRRGKTTSRWTRLGNLSGDASLMFLVLEIEKTLHTTCRYKWRQKRNELLVDSTSGNYQRKLQRAYLVSFIKASRNTVKNQDRGRKDGTHTLKWNASYYGLQYFENTHIFQLKWAIWNLFTLTGRKRFEHAWTSL